MDKVDNGAWGQPLNKSSSGSGGVWGNPSSTAPPTSSPAAPVPSTANNDSTALPAPNGLSVAVIVQMLKTPMLHLQLVLINLHGRKQTKPTGAVL